MKKKAICSLFIILFFMTSKLTVFSATYTFAFPDYTQSVGSMRWTPATQLVSTGQHPYVYPDTASIKTFYFLTPYHSSTIQATNIKACDTHQAKYFSWNTGYGGEGNAYFLAGYPDSSIYHRPAYTISGYWTVD